MNAGRHFIISLAILAGLTLTSALLILLSNNPLAVRAAPNIYYVRQGGTGLSCTADDPCGLITEALKMATFSGDQVWVAEGTYHENLIVPYGITLLGGWNPSFTVRSPISYPTIVDGGGNHVVEVTVGEGAALLDGFIFQNGRDGIHIYAGTVTVTNNVIRNVTRQGIEVERGSILLQNNLITAIDREGIEIDGGAVTVRANRVYTTGRHAILIEGGTTVIEHNVIRTVLPDPQADYHGINILTGTHVISGNQVSNIDDRGIYVQGGSAKILGNLVRDTGGDGIRTGVASSYVKIRDNIIRNPGNDGIDARGVYLIVAGNSVADAADRGINGENGVLIIAGNMVCNARGDGLRTASSATRVEISGNTVYTAGNDGMDVRGNFITILRNEVRGSADNGIRAEGSKTVEVQANRVFSTGTGLAVRESPLFTVTNNFVGKSITSSIELSGTGSGYVYHNTLVGGMDVARGVGVYILSPLTLTLYNNIVVSHEIGLIASRGVHLDAGHTLLWGNKDNAPFGDAPIIAPPRFADPDEEDYHLLPGSPAIDAGAEVGVRDDIDGHPRPLGAAPDIGADEFAAALRLTKRAVPAWAQTGQPLNYTIFVTNTGIVTLTVTVTDVLPAGVSPSGLRVWAATIPAPGGVWSATVTVTVNADHTGPLVNVVQATSAEGAKGVFTHTMAPALSVAKLATPQIVRPGGRIEYTILVTNTGNFDLHATITDTLPLNIGSWWFPGGTGVTPGTPITWTAFITAPGGVWRETVVVTAESGYTGPLTNVVEVTTREDARGRYISVVWAMHSVYLPLVLRQFEAGL